jgi:uncharacterized protein (TIGR02145 family)
MKNILFFIIAASVIIPIYLSAQVAINADGSEPAASAMLDVQSTSHGVLFPRLTNAERDAIASPATGLVIYNTQVETLQYYDGSSWVLLTEGNCGLPFYDSVNDQCYETIVIGSQCWFAENLASTKYNDGTDIPHVTSNSDWAALTTPGYCWYDNNASNADIYGALYNWYAVEMGNLCPTGWHVPTDGEWTNLEDFLIANGYNYDGTTTGNKIAKSLATGFDWGASSSVGAVGNNDYPEYRNKSGFRGLSGGYRFVNGSFLHVGLFGYWWTSTEYDSDWAWDRYLFYSHSDVYRFYDGKEGGFSVRCLRDN